MSILTIGHSTRTLEDFLGILRAYGVGLIVDVRTIPRSKRHPQFNQDVLSESLRGSGIDYVSMRQLGGFRHPTTDSLNLGWRNLSFRGFADYMQTQEFFIAIDDLLRVAEVDSTAIMCSEILPWRCHRSLIADSLVVRGIEVEHIMTLTSRRKHILTKWARVEKKQITYPKR